jgi:predicted NUDIX family phosphoesterase
LILIGVVPSIYLTNISERKDIETHVIIFLDDLFEVALYLLTIGKSESLLHVKAVLRLYGHFRDDSHGAETADARPEEFVGRLNDMNLALAVDDLQVD